MFFIVDWLYGGIVLQRLTPKSANSLAPAHPSASVGVEFGHALQLSSGFQAALLAITLPRVEASLDPC